MRISSLKASISGAAFLLMFTSYSSAHPNHGASWGERYLKIDIEETHIRVVYGLTLTSRAGNKLRSLADRDRDGVVSLNEAQSYGSEFVTKLHENVQIMLDGRRMRAQWSQPATIGLFGAGARGPISIETNTELLLHSGRSPLTLVDRAEFEGIYRTTATIGVSSQVVLTACGRGTTVTGIRKRIVFLDLPEEGPPPSRAITAEFELPGSQGLATTVWLAVAASFCWWGFVMFFYRTWKG